MIERSARSGRSAIHASASILTRASSTSFATSTSTLNEPDLFCRNADVVPPPRSGGVPPSTDCRRDMPKQTQPSHSGKFPESALFLQELSQVTMQQYGSALQIASQQSISLQPGEPLDV